MLKNKVSIYVPSTYHDAPAPDNVVNYYVQDTLRQLAALYGGSTATTGKGFFMSEEKGAILDNVTICYSFCKKYKKSDLVKICRNLKTVFLQESIGLEINGHFYFV